MYTRTLAAAGAAALLMGLVATAPAHAGLRLNSQELNGLRLNGLRFNGTDGPGIVHTGPGGVGFNFNAVKLHAVTLPDTAR